MAGHEEAPSTHTSTVTKLHAMIPLFLFMLVFLLLVALEAFSATESMACISRGVERGTQK